ncbi:DUF6541 family protein [Varibaculum cambriense]|uniref:DUF6541 family protein n=1 Tax=Varibaculum cambriense TaxID=184870 RepID=UPI00291547ED|nr:DUF6541 family protein [Varibaculum cambriense]MDU3274918.1 DUF6541 family protein [Varibaculum cambriense]
MTIFSPATPEQFFYNWWLFPLPLLVALATVFVPGLAVGRLIGLRNKWLWAWAPAASVAIASVTAIAAGKMGITWGFLPLLAATLLLLLVCWMGKFIRRKFSSTPRHFPKGTSLQTVPTPKNNWQLPVAFIAVFILATIWFATVIKLPGAFAQSWDNAFHLNLAMMFTQNGNASSLAANIVGTDPTGYYPAAWHGLVSLIASTCSRSVVVATNALTIVVAFLVWPLSIYTFTSEVTSNKVASTLSIPVSLAFPQFPMGFVGYGTLYPNLLGYAFIPLCAALLINCLRKWPHQIIYKLCLAVVAITAASVSHPNSIFVIAIFYVVIAWWFTLRAILKRLASAQKHKVVRTLFVLGWSLLWFGIYVSWDRFCYRIAFIHAMRGPEAYNFNPVSETYGKAIKDLFLITGGTGFNGSYQHSFLLLVPLAILVWVGFFRISRFPRQWLLCFTWVPLAFYYLVVTGMQNISLRRYFVGVWYNDAPRVFAPIIFVAVPLAAIGAASIWGLFLRFVPKIRSVKTRVMTFPLYMACLALFAIWGPLPLKSTGPWVSTAFEIPKPSIDGYQLIDTDELKLLFSLPKYIPENDAVLANPWEGGTFTWAIGERRAVFPKISGNVYPDSLRPLAKTLDSQQDPQVCKKMEAENSHYLLELRDQYLWGESGWEIEKQYPALDNIDPKTSKLVKQVGDAKLLRYEGCNR